MTSHIVKPKITIGVPVFNGGKTIKKALDSLLAQTFTNFELIISDNGSTDTTSQICNEYEQKDARINYIRREKTVEPFWNFIYLVEKANGEYFMWAAVDDYWHPDFIKKNLEILELRHDLVASISDVQLFGPHNESYYKDGQDSNSDSIVKLQYIRPIVGTYEKKVRNILQFNWILNIYSVFRTNRLKESLIYKSFASWDFAVILNLIKFGDLHVLDEILMHRYTGSITATNSFLELLRKQRFSKFWIFFPYVSFTLWCMKNLGFKIFIKNFSFFLHLNIHAERKILRELKNSKKRVKSLS